MKYVELIIFDLDGTLVDSKEAIAKGINFALKKVGLKEKSVKEISSYIGIGVDHLIKESLGAEHKNLFERTKSALENYRREFANDFVLYPGVKEMLEYFKDKRKVIITNGKHEFALLTLKELGISDYFDDILGGDDLECVKPSACPLERIVDKLDIDKERTIMVGDMHLDVLAGKNAGITTCAVTYGIGKKEDILKARPDYVIDDIVKLKKIIN